MINEEKFTKVKEKLAIRKAVKEVQSILWNPKSVLSWLYGVIVYILIPSIAAIIIYYTGGNVVAFFLGAIIGVPIGNVMVIADRYIFYREQIELDDE